MSTDRKELMLQQRYEAACLVLDAAFKHAREAVRLRNQAKQKYQRALHDLVTYRERAPKKLQ